MFTTGANNKNFNQDIKNLIKQGKNAKVKSSIKGMTPSKLVDSSKTSLLHLAAKYNNCDLTKYLIKIKCNVNAKNNSKITPLMMAATSSSFKTVQLLIEANADIYWTNSSNRSALQLLLNNKKIPRYVISCCLRKVKSDSSSDKAIAKTLFTANCPLHVVIHLKKPSITRMILNHYDQIDPQQTRAAMELALKLRDQKNVSVLLEFGVEIDIRRMEAVLFLNEICPWKQAADEGCLSLISAFLERVTDWNSIMEGSIYWFGSFFQRGSKEMLELFLQHKINDYVKNKFPGQDLFVNIYGNYSADVRQLLKHLQFDVNARGKDEFTALHYAIGRSCLDDVKTLLHLGANPNIRDRYGRVPLAFVHSYYDYTDSEVKLDSNERKIIELLLLAGADPQLDMCITDNLWHYSFSPTKLELMMAQIAIDESLSKPIKEEVRQNINNLPKILSVYESCCQQLEKMKTMKVHCSITLYTILVTDAAKIAISIRDREALEAMCSDIEQLHFFYASKLKNSVHQILHTIDLRMKVSTFICETTGWANSQYIILDKILSFLTYNDLLVFD